MLAEQSFAERVGRRLPRHPDHLGAIAEGGWLDDRFQLLVGDRITPSARSLVMMIGMRSPKSSSVNS
jgi:hypothetical protein